MNLPRPFARSFSSATSAALLAALAGCGGGGGGAATDPISQREQEAIARFNSTPIALRGQVVSAMGAPLENALVRIGGRTVRSGAEGQFLIEGLSRRNALLTASADAHRDEQAAVFLQHPASDAEVILQPLVLSPTGAQGVRFLFAGDTSFGRRFLDPDADTPPDQVPPSDPQALIQSADPVPGSRKVLSFIQPVLDAADFRAVNLETPVTSQPATPHPTKDFVFFTLPASLSALRNAGVDYAGLGNNHVYDYLEAGIADTLRHVAAAGLAHSGAGRQAAEAFAPSRVSLGGSRYSLLSMSSISGADHPITYVATETKGGSADLRDTVRVRSAIAAEVAAGAYPIAILHTGQEYTESPSDFALDRMRTAAEAGASLVVAHHPHVAQGFSRHQGVLMAHSLGNFAFDQDRLETMLGLLARVDMQAGEVRRAQAIPVYLEDYRPRPIAGALADRFIRRIGQDSQAHGTTVMPVNGRGRVLGAAETARVFDRELTVTVSVGPQGFGVLDLRGLLQSGESLYMATTLSPGVRLVAGRDRLEHGEFEDYDLDDQVGETTRWDTSGTSSFACLMAPRSGAMALCSRRQAGDSQDSVVALRNRVRVLGDPENEPNKRLTLYGWARGESAGAVRVVARYYASEGEASFGEETAVSLDAGSFGWRPFTADLSMPADTTTGGGAENARAVRLFIRHSPPLAGQALASLDDLAIINWQSGATASAVTLPVPNANEFLRAEGAPGDLQLRVVLRRLE
ncbi:CapA family protein [Ramlibacter rhizophilus]|nr:CapA family protein [Ramlibacter rhizophilus]